VITDIIENATKNLDEVIAELQNGREQLYWDVGFEGFERDDTSKMVEEFVQTCLGRPMFEMLEGIDNYVPFRWWPRRT
jgi:hypothetical protein